LSNQLLDERRTLRRLGTTSDSEFVMLMGLVFGRLFAKEAPDGFTKGQFSSGATSFAIGESVTAQIVDLRGQFAQF
jgi:hypothetical protein